MERFFAILLLIGGLAGAAAFAHRAGSPADSSFAAPFAQPATHGASSEVLQIAPVAVGTAIRPAPVETARPPLRLAAPVRRLVSAPLHVAPVAPVAPVAVTAAQPAPEPVVPVAAAPAPAPAPAPAAPAAPAQAPAPAVPILPPVVALPAAHDRGNGKDRGKAKGRNKDVAEVTPVADTIAPADPVDAVAPTTPDVPVLASDGDQHGRGHDDQDK